MATVRNQRGPGREPLVHRGASPNTIGRITPAGVITHFSAGLTSNALPQGITAGPDGNLWFTEKSKEGIGRITPAGVITEFTAGLTADSGPNGIAAGPDGNLWFTESTTRGGSGGSRRRA